MVVIWRRRQMMLDYIIERTNKYIDDIKQIKENDFIEEDSSSK